VADSTGAALPSVRLALKAAEERVERTDAGGRFAFTGVPPGEYELIVELEGFATLRRRVRVSQAGNDNLTLVLTPGLSEYTVVTADKTGERHAQDTPVAVTVLPGEELRRSEAHTVADLGVSVPSLTFSQNTGFAQVTIRGIGTNNVFAGSDPSSTVYLDGVYLARPAGALVDFLDVERVEVLRGPQGTLYGRNAVGGSVNLVTRAPADTFDASARLAVGGFGLVRSELRVGGPIVANRLRGSVAMLRGVRRGSVRNLEHPDNPLGGEDAAAMSAKLDWSFGSAGSLLLAVDGVRQEPVPLVYAKVLAVKPGFVVQNPSDLHEVRANTAAWSDRKQGGASARLTLRLAPTVVLTSLSAFRKLDYELYVDADITELDLTISNVREIHRQWSQEETVAGQTPRMSWVAGLFVFDEHDRQPTRVPFPSAGRENQLDPDVDASSRAAFAQATFRLSARLSATAGLRFTREHKTIDNAGRFVTLGPTPTVLPATAYAYQDEIRSDAWTPRLGLESQVLPGALVYISATRGFKTGGFNLSSPAAGRGFAPEWVWSYEAGLKKTIGQDRAWVNIAAFQADYSDLQVQSSIAPGVIDISNAAEATIRGIETEGRVQITPSVRGGGHLAWLDARYDRYVAVGVGGITGDVAGRRLSNAPEWSGRLWLEWSRLLPRATRLLLRADTRWQSTAYFTPFNDDIQRQNPYALLDATAEYGPRTGPWSVGVFGRNLTDENYITGSFNSPPPAIGGRPGDPRQVGLQFTLRR
jgi:iron complex outermembrane receptor protein